jgi:putative hydrolase of the HAD superfamily
VVAAFDDIFVSSELGVRKPEQRAFETVVQKMGVDPASVLFFDDLPQNVAGAEALGIRAVQVRSPQDIRRALTANALL